LELSTNQDHLERNLYELIEFSHVLEQSFRLFGDGGGTSHTDLGDLPQDDLEGGMSIGYVSLSDSHYAMR